MDKIWLDAGHLLWKELHEKKKQKEWSPILSFDRPKIHNVQKVMDRLGILEGNILPLTHYVPDVQKVVEHCHANNNRKLKQLVLEKGTKKPPQDYQEMLRKAFMSIGTDQGKLQKLQQDIQSLDATLKHIKKPRAEGGSEGGFALPPYN